MPAAGAALLIPFTLLVTALTGGSAFSGLVTLSAAGAALFGVGALMSLFSGRNAFLGGVRMLMIGAAAGAATFFIGRLFGVAAA